MTGQEPFELLASLRGDDTDDYIKPGDDPIADALLQRIMDVITVASSTPRPGRRRRRVVAVAVAGVLVASGAVAAAVWLDQPADPATLSCYSDASLDPEVQVGLPIDAESTPVEQCATLWRDGTLASGDAPPLTACVTTNGITAVIPGDDGTCTTLGLAGRDPSVDPDDTVAARILSTISDQYPADCVDSVDQAVAIVEEILADVEADGWEIRRAGAVTDERPCAYAAVDASTQVVLIVTAAGAP